MAQAAQIWPSNESVLNATELPEELELSLSLSLSLSLPAASHSSRRKPRALAASSCLLVSDFHGVSNAAVSPSSHDVPLQPSFFAADCSAVDISFQNLSLAGSSMLDSEELLDEELELLSSSSESESDSSTLMPLLQSRIAFTRFWTSESISKPSSFIAAREVSTCLTTFVSARCSTHWRSSAITPGFMSETVSPPSERQCCSSITPFDRLLGEVALSSAHMASASASCPAFIICLSAFSARSVSPTPDAALMMALYEPSSGLKSSLIFLNIRTIS